jgi:hypothetical protein
MAPSPLLHEKSHVGYYDHKIKSSTENTLSLAARRRGWVRRCSLQLVIVR